MNNKKMCNQGNVIYNHIQMDKGYFLYITLRQKRTGRTKAMRRQLMSVTVRGSKTR